MTFSRVRNPWRYHLNNQFSYLWRVFLSLCAPSLTSKLSLISCVGCLHTGYPITGESELQECPPKKSIVSSSSSYICVFSNAISSPWCLAATRTSHASCYSILSAWSGPHPHAFHRSLPTVSKEKKSIPPDHVRHVRPIVRRAKYSCVSLC
jgi:hypothetical protein